MEIKTLEHTDFETLFNGFENAFSDYAIHFEKEEVRSMLRRRGYDPRLSFAAFDNGGIVAFTLNGIGVYDGVLTAYDTGTGTIAGYRGQGLAGKIFARSIPLLKEAGVRQYLLEVLQENRKAITVYRQLGFEVTREFDCFRQSVGDIAQGKVKTDCIVRQVEAGAVRQAQEYCDFYPSWQNSMSSIERGIPDLKCLGAFQSGRMVGYCVFDPHTGDLTRIAVQRGCRRKGIGSRLLHEAVDGLSTDFIKVLNINSDYRAMHGFLESLNIPLASSQFEMRLPIR